MTTAVLVRPWDQKPDEDWQQQKQQDAVNFSALGVRVVVSNVSSGKVSFETRLPAGFMEPIAAAVPQLVCAMPWVFFFFFFFFFLPVQSAMQLHLAYSSACAVHLHVLAR